MAAFGSLAPVGVWPGAGLADDPAAQARIIATANALGDTWPARLMKALMGSVTQYGDAVTGKQQVPIGLRREDFTDIPASGGFGSFGSQPIDPTIERTTDLASALMSGTFGAPAGAVGSGATRRAAATLPMDEASRMARAKAQGYETTPVYHGTVDEFASFDPNRVGTSGHDYGEKAYWFTDDPKVASDYAGVAPRSVRDAGYEAKAAYDELRDYESALRLTPGALKKTQIRKLEELEEAAQLREDDIEWALDAWRRSDAGREGVTPGAQVIPAYLRMKNPFRADAGGARFDRVMADFLYDAKAGGHDSMVVSNVVDAASKASDFPTTVRAVFDPKQIRSQFAAFDPKKKNSANLLAVGATDPVAALIQAILANKPQPQASE